MGSVASTPKKTTSGITSAALSSSVGPSVATVATAPNSHPIEAARALRQRPIRIPSTLPLTQPIAATQKGSRSRATPLSSIEMAATGQAGSGSSETH